MKRTILLSLAVAFLMCILVVSALGSNPGMINYQAVLKDSSGEPVNGNVNVTFTIYDSEVGDNIMWQETHSDVAVSEGYLNVILGQGTPPIAIGDTVFASSERWLGISIGEDPEIAPRTRLVSVPYSHRVSTLQGAEAGEINGVLNIGPASKNGDRYESGIVVTGNYSDSVIISPADDIIVRGTTDDGDAAVSIITTTNAGVSTGVVEVSSTDAAKAGSRKVLINPGDSILLQGIDGEGDAAVTLSLNETGGVIEITSSDAAKDPNAVTSSVMIAPSRNVALEAINAADDTLIRITTENSSGEISLLSNTSKGLNRVLIRHDGIYFLDETRSDTNMIISADGNIIGKGQVAMGQQNQNPGLFANVLGYGNQVTYDSSSILGGYANLVGGRSSAVGAGHGNVVTKHNGFVGAGVDNLLTGTSGVIVGGNVNRAASTQSAVVCGYGCVAGSWRCFVGTGQYNVAGDTLSMSDSYESAVVAGSYNRAIKKYSSIIGGYQNEASGAYTVCAGGQDNTSSGAGAVVAGGGSTDLYASSGNTASGELSMVPGGSANEAQGLMSLAAGRRAKATHDGTFVWADTQDVDFNSAAANEFAARATGGVRFVSAVDGSGTPTAGVQLSAGGGSWSSLCDVNAKENIERVDAEQILKLLCQLDIASWNYRSQDESVRHIGPMAQDFHEAFRVGESEKHITAIDADGVALAAIQALSDMNQEQSTEIEELRSEIESLRAMVKKLLDKTD